MTRPTYETDHDLSNERVVADQLEAKWKCELLKLPKYWPLDYCCVRGKNVMAWVEIKCRNYTFKQLDDLGGYHIDLRKIAAMRELVTLTEKPGFLVVRLTDGLYNMKLMPLLPVDAVIGGRKDRNDPADIEPCATFKMSNFMKVD